MYQLACFSELFDNEEHISYIDPDTALYFGFENDIATHRFPIPVECQPQQFTVAVEHGTAGIATRIALAHTVFNVLLVLAFLPFTKQLARLLTLVFRDRPLIVPTLTHLDIRMLEAPLICLEQSRREILQMGAVVGEMMTALREIEVKGVGSCRQLVTDLFAQEERLDVMQKEVVVFLAFCPTTSFFRLFPF